MRPQIALEAAGRYLTRHPEEIGRALRGALGLRFGVPLAAFRWLGEELGRGGKVEDLRIDALPPGIRVGAKFDLMRTPVRGAATIFIERVQVTEDEASFTVRLEDVALKLDGNAESPVAALIRSGALDLSKPGNLVVNLPNMPPIIAEARDNRIMLDLMRDRKLSSNPRVRQIVGLLTGFVTLHSIQTDSSHLEVSFRGIPSGLFGAASAVRRHVVLPALGRLLPG